MEQGLGKAPSEEVISEPRDGNPRKNFPEIQVLHQLNACVFPLPQIQVLKPSS